MTMFFCVPAMGEVEGWEYIFLVRVASSDISQPWLDSALVGALTR